MEKTKILRIISLLIAFLALLFSFYTDNDSYSSIAGIVSSLGIIVHTLLLFKERKKAKESNV